MVGKIYISNLTSESFSILWNGTEEQFDGFILEIIDSDWLMKPKEYNISRNVRSHDVTGLRPSTDYIAYLYGTYKGSRTSAVSTVASTGILNLCALNYQPKKLGFLFLAFKYSSLVICSVELTCSCMHTLDLQKRQIHAF